jgi:phosphoglycerate dehydrogenase-like enzyme
LWQDVTILVTLFNLPLSRSEAPRLRWIHLASAGFDHIINLPITKEPGITLTTSSGCSSPRIAEWVISTALAHSHRILTLYEQQKKGLWARQCVDENTSKHMVGARLGILGYGSIGRQVARVGKAMGMDVIVYTAKAKDTAEAREFAGFTMSGMGDPNGSIPSKWYSGGTKQALHSFLAQDIDILLVSVPYM